MGIIDTLTAGFNTVAKRIWLILLPVALDLALWLGPKISIGPMLDNALGSLQRMATSTGAEVQFPEMVELSRELLGSINLLSLFAWTDLGMPSVARQIPIDLVSDRVIEVASLGLTLWLVPTLLVTGLLVTCLYLVLIGQQVRDERIELLRALRLAPRSWIHMLLLLVPLRGIAFSALTVGSLLGPLVFVAAGMVLWLLLYLYFAPQAITMTEADPLSALRDSFIVVRISFWPTLGLIALSYLITAGLSMLWTMLASTQVGMLVTIVGNAYVRTGLTAAAFIFFRDRMAIWHDLIAQHTNASSNA